MLLKESITPFIGTDSIKLYQTITDIKKILAAEGVGFHEEIWSSQSETVPNPWTVIIIDRVMSLFFAKNNKLFKMVFWQDYSGSLPNGIRTGMKVSEATETDSSLAFDDWNEDYESDAGYWLEDDVDSGEIISISIFIRELLDEDQFDHCNW